MNNCVLEAFTDHIKHIDLPFPPCFIDRAIFASLKHFIHGNTEAMLFGGAVPAVIQTLASGYPVELTVQLTPWTVAHCLASAGTDLQRSLAQSITGQEVETISLAPAIYLPFNFKHAFFAEQLPAGWLAMAIQLNVVALKGATP